MNQQAFNYAALGTAIILLLAVGLFLAFGGGKQPVTNAAQESVPFAANVERVTDPPKQFTPPPAAPSPQDEARRTIADYQKKIDAGPKSEETAALQYAMGNLYRQKLGDYRKAAEAYEWFIQEYPDSPDLGKAYVQLALCYEQLKEGEKLNRLYLDMSRRFPKDSQEYLYLKDKLHW